MSCDRRRKYKNRMVEKRKRFEVVETFKSEIRNKQSGIIRNWFIYEEKRNFAISMVNIN